MRRTLATVAILIVTLAAAALVVGQMQGWFTNLSITLPTVTPTPTGKPTVTNSPDVTPTTHPTGAPTTTPNPTQTKTPTPTPLLSPTATPTNKPNPTPTPNPSYTHRSYVGYGNITWDGKWTTNTEWLDAGPITTSANISFRNRMIVWENSSGISKIWENILIETSDNTLDSGDYWEICVDCKTNMGGTPQPDDFKINIAGHTNVTWYRGNGTNWIPATVPSTEYFIWNNSINTSPIKNGNHWICEVGLERIGLSIDATFCMRIAVYDAHNEGLELQSWPPAASADTPNNWGSVDFMMMLAVEKDNSAVTFPAVLIAAYLTFAYRLNFKLNLLACKQRSLSVNLRFIDSF